MDQHPPKDAMKDLVPVAPKDDNSLLVDAWKVAQENARHFNGLLMQIRGFAILLSGGFISGAFTVGQKLGEDQAGMALFAFGFVWFTFYLLDRMYYHTLLQATVEYAASLEKRIFSSRDLPELSAYVKRRNHQMGLFMRYARGKPDEVKSRFAISRGGEKIAFFYGLPMALALGGAMGMLSDVIQTRTHFVPAAWRPWLSGVAALLIFAAVLFDLGRTEYEDYKRDDGKLPASASPAAASNTA